MIYLISNTDFISSTKDLFIFLSNTYTTACFYDFEYVFNPNNKQLAKQLESLDFPKNSQLESLGYLLKNVMYCNIRVPPPTQGSSPTHHHPTPSYIMVCFYTCAYVIKSNVMFFLPPSRQQSRRQTSV